MTDILDLNDIQGNIVKAYGRFGFPKARYVFLHVTDGRKGREFVSALTNEVTTAAKWSKDPESGNSDKPFSTLNIALTYSGLSRLGLSAETLKSFPSEFIMGMKNRRDILGDDAASAPDHWDTIWQQDKAVDILLSINGRKVSDIEDKYQSISDLLTDSDGGVELLKGHKGPDGESDFPYQDASAVFENGLPSNKEHFGYSDGISNPYFKGCGKSPEQVIGNGKPTGGDPATIDGWAPLETGEFILGYRDEAEEYPVAPMPRLLSHNGSFMVYRKLHQNVGLFNQYINEQGANFPGGTDAISAKFVGRWKNGAPLSLFPDKEKADDFISRMQQIRKQLTQAEGNEKSALIQEMAQLRSQLSGYNFDHDLSGGRCPVGAHSRRVNPRGSLEFGNKGAFNTPGALTDRRRLLRRGLPYGEVNDPDDNSGEHGIIFITVGASIKRQFEFVQQQWINYGNDFKLSNDKDPVLGNHGTRTDGSPDGNMVIEGEEGGDKPPFFCASMPRFVETRGGDYFFIPSITALKMIAEGIVDPT